MKRRMKRILPLVFLTAVLMLATVPAPVAAYGACHHNIIIKAYDLLKPFHPILDLPYLGGGCWEVMKLGSTYADNETANPLRKYHYMTPLTHSSLWWHDVSWSAGKCADYGFEMAKEVFDPGNPSAVGGAWWWIGFVVHHIQDLTNPAHTDSFDGGFRYHLTYEKYWCDKYCSHYLEGTTEPIFTFESSYTDDVVHCDPSTAFGWVDYAAHQSVLYEDYMKDDRFDETAHAMLPLAAELTAGFMLFAYHTFYPSSDVDRDTLSYSKEMELGTLPWDDDTDNDIIRDDWEVKYGLNPLINDAALDKDRDGLKNVDEYLLGTRPDKADTDGDGLNDYQEVYIYLTKPRVADSDGDKMPDGWEATYGLNPNDPSDAGQDMDRDGVSNADEYRYWANPKKADTDGDGLTDKLEIQIGTFPCLSDSDGDGWSDYYEHTNGYDPMDPDSHPGSIPEPPPGPILDP